MAVTKIQSDVRNGQVAMVGAGIIADTAINVTNNLGIQVDVCRGR
ncbi:MULTISPECIES: hypothetical protein [unclassified Cryobacterium]